MILVIFGTQKQEFKRLFDLIENSKELENEDIIAQAGNTKYKGEKIQAFDFLPPNVFDKYVEDADYIITHGGVGSILTALQRKKKVLAVPRLAKYKEHVNDHQLEICQKLESLDNIIYYSEEKDFDECIKTLKTHNFEPYVSNQKYLEILREQI